MTDKEIIIDGYKLEDIKNLLFTGQKMAISTKTFEAIIEQLEVKEQECEELKKKKNYMQFGYKQALEKIEKILKYYVTSSMGVKNLNGTFSLKNEQEAVILDYDPRKAIEGLKIINEVKDAD